MPNKLFIEGQIEALAESAEGVRPSWDVVLIRPGLSKNQTYYSEAILQKAAKLFEGAPAFARSDQDHSWDADKSVKNIVGLYKEVEYREGALRGKLHILSEGQWLHDKMVEAKGLGQHNLFGLSIVAGGVASMKKRNGAFVRMVESIDYVTSVDPVVNPAAGGRFVKLAAAENDQLQGEIDMLKALLAMIEAKRPDLLKGKDLESITEAAVMELAGQAMFTEAEIAAAVAAKAPEKKEEPADPVKLAEARIEAFEKKSACRLLLNEKLSESKLPAESQARVRRLMPEVFAEADLDKEIASEKDFVAKFSETGKVQGAGGSEIALDERDRKLAALDGFFLGEAQKVGDQMVPPYRSFKKAYRDITGDVGITGLLREATNLRHFTEALTVASWPQVLGDSITRKLLAEYRSPAYEGWKKVCSSIGSISDFRTNRRMRIGGYGILPGVLEGAPYVALASPTDEEATYAISKRGGLETITLEMIANDDVGAIRRVPVSLALAAKITLYRGVFDIFVTNAATTYDATPLFDALHLNLGATALTQAGLTATRQLMRDQAAYNQAINVLGLTPKTLLVPNELEEMAFLLTKAGLMIPAAAGLAPEQSSLPQLHTGMSYEVVDYWTDANDWVAAGNPNEVPMIEVGFFNGQEEPELFLQDAPNVGSMFANDILTYKIRHIWGTCTLEHRGLYKHIVI
jgi:hypothetical protein